ELPEEPIGEALHPEEEEEEVEDREPVSSRPLDLPDVVEEPELPVIDEEEEGEGDAVGRVDTLPEAITAEMLRARRNKTGEMPEDFEIPAELLVGLDEEDLDDEWEEEEDKRGRGKGKAPAKAAKKPKKSSKPDSKSKGKKWRPQLADDDDF